MKTCCFTSVIAVLFMLGCGESLLDSRYALELPELPDAWEAVLGSPSWQVEWVSDKGRKERITVQGSTAIFLPQTWASAVLALPFWPEKGIGPGIFRPAGAIFPFDASGGTLVLSWQGGIDAYLFWELAQIAGNGGAAGIRMPHNFNWPRFRGLFADPSLNADVRADPWLADWNNIAARIVQSGFDRRRLVPEARTSLQVPVGPGPWVGTSPFTAPLLFEGIPAFPVRQAADTWVSSEGILRCNTETWILLPSL